jgi:hypothetical protein
MASFSGTLRGMGNNTGIEVPEDVVLGFGRGKRVPVTVTVNGYTYRSTISARGGAFYIPLSAAIRAETGLAADDPIDVTLEVDDAPREVEVPPELAGALADDPVATEAWNKLSYSGKRRHTLAIEAAKAADTKTRRVAKTLATLRGEE